MGRRPQRSQLCRRARAIPTGTCLCIRHKLKSDTHTSDVNLLVHFATSACLRHSTACAFATSARLKHSSDWNILVHLVPSACLKHSSDRRTIAHLEAVVHCEERYLASRAWSGSAQQSSSNTGHTNGPLGSGLNFNRVQRHGTLIDISVFRQLSCASRLLNVLQLVSRQVLSQECLECFECIPRKSLAALLKSVRGSWVGAQIAHSLAEERARY